jgi:CheY-like chemotaxis protein
VTLLVVDDNLQSRSAMLELVTAWGARAEVAGGLGAAAPEFLLCAVKTGGEDGGIGLRMLRHVSEPVSPSLLLEAPTEACSSLGLVEEQRLSQGETPVPASSRHALPAVTWSIVPRILLVEDNLMNQKVAQYNLRELGCLVDTARNGREAVEMAGRFDYDLIFMDCLMPEVDGFEATAQIRAQDGERRHVPIVAMTANAMLGDRERCLAAGMDDYASKPVSADTLARVMAAFFAEDQTVSESPSFHEETPEGAPEETPEEQSRELRPAGEVLRHLYPGNPGLVADLAALFLEEGALHLAGLEQALTQGDACGVAFSAHTLKGMAGNLRLSGLAEAFSDLERMGRSGRLEGAVSRWAQARSAYEAVKVELEEFLDRSADRDDGPGESARLAA